MLKSRKFSVVNYRVLHGHCERLRNFCWHLVAVFRIRICIIGGLLDPDRCGYGSRRWKAHKENWKIAATHKSEKKRKLKNKKQSILVVLLVLNLLLLMLVLLLVLVLHLLDLYLLGLLLLLLLIVLLLLLLILVLLVLVLLLLLVLPDPYKNMWLIADNFGILKDILRR